MKKTPKIFVLLICLSFWQSITYSQNEKRHFILGTSQYFKQKTEPGNSTTAIHFQKDWNSRVGWSYFFRNNLSVGILFEHNYFKSNYYNNPTNGIFSFSNKEKFFIAIQCSRYRRNGNNKFIFSINPYVGYGFSKEIHSGYSPPNPFTIYSSKLVRIGTFPCLQIKIHPKWDINFSTFHLSFAIVQSFNESSYYRSVYWEGDLDWNLYFGVNYYF